MWLDLTLDPSFKVKRGEPNLKVLATHLLLVLEVWYGKPTYRRSWAGNMRTRSTRGDAKPKDERSRKSKHCLDREFVEVLIFPSKRASNNGC